MSYVIIPNQDSNKENDPALITRPTLFFYQTKNEYTCHPVSAKRTMYDDIFYSIVPCVLVPIKNQRPKLYIWCYFWVWTSSGKS